MQNIKQTNTQLTRYFISFNFLLLMLSTIAFSSAEGAPQNIKSPPSVSKIEIETYIKKYKSYPVELHNAINKNDCVKEGNKLAIRVMNSCYSYGKITK